MADAFPAQQIGGAHGIPKAQQAAPLVGLPPPHRAANQPTVAIEHLGPQPRTYVMPQAYVTVPQT